MAAKMADFMQKYVHLYNAGYIEAFMQIIMAKVMFWNIAQNQVASLHWCDCFSQKKKMAANIATYTESTYALWVQKAYVWL